MFFQSVIVAFFLIITNLLLETSLLGTVPSEYRPSVFFVLIIAALGPHCQLLEPIFSQHILRACLMRRKRYSVIFTRRAKNLLFDRPVRLHCPACPRMPVDRNLCRLLFRSETNADCMRINLPKNSCKLCKGNDSNEIGWEVTANKSTWYCVYSQSLKFTDVNEHFHSSSVSNFCKLSKDKGTRKIE